MESTMWMVTIKQRLVEICDNEYQEEIAWDYISDNLDLYDLDDTDALEDAAQEAAEYARDEYEERANTEGTREYFVEHDGGIGWCVPVEYVNKKTGEKVEGVQNEGKFCDEEGNVIDTSEMDDDEDWERNEGNCHTCPYLKNCQAFDNLD